jgi:hypothetical protein
MRRQTTKEDLKMITNATLKVQGTEPHLFFRILQENYAVAENFGPCGGNIFRSIEICQHGLCDGIYRQAL